MSVFAFALVIASPRAAGADPLGELRARLSYSTPPGCSSEAEFIGLLGQHSDVVIDPSASTELVIAVERAGKQYRGRVAVTAAEEGEVRREVIADRCSDVVRGLALFSAMALDAYFEQRAAPEVERPPTTAESRDDAIEAKRHAGERARIGPAPPRVVRKQRLRFAVGAGAQGAAGSGPLYHLAAGGEVLLPHGPSFRFAINLGTVVPRSYLDGTLTFLMLWSRTEICPAWLTIGQAVRTSICAAADIGVQRAALDDSRVGQAQVRAWLAGGAVARGRVQMGAKLELELGVGGLVPLLPFDFATAAGVVYSTPAIVPTVSLGFAIAFD